MLFFILVLFIIAGCLDIGYMNAKRYDMEKGLEIAALTGVEGFQIYTQQ